MCVCVCVCMLPVHAEVVSAVSWNQKQPLHIHTQTVVAAVRVCGSVGKGD